ncbi:hypothetical protein BHE74_00013297 [Ensete ventricosum]|uniref:Probable histone-arginine methyltransferase CARM1-like N-terminal PH domain-containing protein n=1 Tax=Ensete ventricosum TaxID=4639 RepID=A0A426Z0K9_ENSVE|nr:hypothetical protein B296_00016316 [Ensete ventricosum]RWW33545.1 hypothetical protein GW17_00001730 [Ensete ventricosum]RWW78498.1 hypothetical protein BHE74_00013297 [Ensete ventricosum]RZR97158.1 hypothetical protein BHM03_00026297 [Ensete ventricosum]
MEDPLWQKRSPQVFPSITLSHLSSSAPSSSAASAFFSDDRSGCSRLRFHQPCSAVPVFDLDLRKIQIFKLGLLELLCVTNETGDDDPEEAGAKHVYAVEASEMAEYARRLIAGNPSLGQRITV